MKIQRIRIRNFRIHTDSTVDLSDAKFAVFRGRNFSGKTSLGEAISMTLTPSTFGLDQRGAGFVKKIKRGESKSILEVDLQGANRTIRRTVSLNVSAAGRTQKSEDLADPEWVSVKFDSLLDTKKTALGIAINTRAFQSMIYSGDEKAQKNLLAQLVLPSRYEFPKDTISEVESILGEGSVNFGGEPFSVIETAYKKLFAERQDVNRRVKEFIIPDALARPQGVDSVSLKSKLSAVREERAKVAATREEASKKVNAEAQEKAIRQARVKAKIETLEASLAVNKAALRRFDEAILPNPSIFETRASYKARHTQLQEQLNKVITERQSAQKAFDKINEISKSVGALCPTCEQEIEETKIVKIAQGILDDRNRLSEEYEGLKTALDKLDDVDEAISKLEKHREAVSGKSEVVAAIERQTKELNIAKTESSCSGETLFESSTFDQAIADADRKIGKLLEQIQPVIAAEERDKEIATRKEQLEKLEAKAAKLDRLVSFFDKNGIKAKLIATYIGGFEDMVNEVLKAWDYSCSLSIEPFKFEVTNSRGDTSPLIEISGAEEIMFYAAFQCAVSRTAGIGFVVIDKIDTLLPELRPRMYSKLYQMVKDGLLEQVLLLVADTSESVPALPDSSFFMVENGSIRRLL